MKPFCRWMVAVLACAALSGCGFALRSAQQLPFATIAVTPEKGRGVAADVARALGDRLRPVAAGVGGQAPEAILDILEESREKLVVGLSTSGQVREFELRIRLKFRLRSAKGEELIAPSTMEQYRSISFNESAVLAKEAEEVLLYRDMQGDIVQQLLRRMAAVKPAGAVPVSANPPANLLAKPTAAE